MNIQRLKFAWARGARYQRHCHIWSDSASWETMQGAPTYWLHDEDLRIHPDDAHLEYGPLSSALRDRVLCDSESPYDPMQHAAMAYVREYVFVFVDPRMSYSEETWAMFLLFVAEFLADKGL